MGDLGDPFYEISRSLESSLSGLFQAFQAFINQAFLKSFYFATSKHHALVLKGSLSFDFMMERRLGNFTFQHSTYTVQ